MHGLLFSADFLNEGIGQTPGWSASEQAFVVFRDAMTAICRGLSADQVLNEAQTEDEVILPVMKALGWEHFLRQQTANSSGREDVPDFLLFATREAKESARSEPRPDHRYRHGSLILEAKRWGRTLDRSDQSDPFDLGTPSNQMLRYLSRAEIASNRKIGWGILTNGRIWRLYWQNARSRAEEFLQFDLAELAPVAGLNADLFSTTQGTASVHLLRAFFLLFRRESFLPQPGDADGRSFHAIALEEGRIWETRVSQDLGQRVFDEVFPTLSAALARHDPQCSLSMSRPDLDVVHRSALILLYRLLFVLYAEDRALLPVADSRYDDYSLRRIRQDIARRMDQGDVFSATAPRFWQDLRNLFRAIDRGDDSLGLPPYNGGLFQERPGDLLVRTELPDAVLAPILDALSRRPDLSGKAFINYRDLAVQHLGSIYERLLEQRLAQTDSGDVVVRPSPFARKNSGSYYTHDDLVKLILRETVGPLAQERTDAFAERLNELARKRGQEDVSRLRVELALVDPAQALLNLKVCDPAMGSGHFLVSLIDDFADRVLECLADASARAEAAGIDRYQSPVTQDILRLRERIVAQAQAGRWTIDQTLLDDRHLVRRMILKRVVHGADKNAMAVELAKLALWLHTFTVGAPLSFLDHHLRCGDSLFGERLSSVRRDLNQLGPLFNEGDMAAMLTASQGLAEISGIYDVDRSEVERSRSLMDDAYAMLDSLRRVFDFWQALRWVAPLDAPRRLRTDKHKAAAELLGGRYRNTLNVLLSSRTPLQSDDPVVDTAVNALLDECRALAKSEGFLHWELAFPAAYEHLASGHPVGGFDAVIGNPPWDRMKLQEVEWFADRRPEIALQTRAADRKRMVAALKSAHDPLADDYALAERQAEDSARVARSCGEYPLLSGGDINLYSLFVERAMHLVNPKGVVGLLTPSGIAGDKGASTFFRRISTTGRLGALLDFENKKVFFPDIHASFKFCALVFGGERRTFAESRCAFYLHQLSELADPDRIIPLAANDFAAVNPNTGTAPIFRTRRDAELTTRIYRTHPVLVRHVHKTERDPLTGDTVIDRDTVVGEERIYNVRYSRMFDMTNDSGMFRTTAWLDQNGGYKVAPNRWKCGGEDYLPLYEGKMVQAYDHRAASVVVNPENVHRPAQPFPATELQHQDPNWLGDSQFWVAESEIAKQFGGDWLLAFKHVSAPTNVRTVISSICPRAGYGNSLPLFIGDDACHLALLQANLNAIAFDFIARQKLQGQNLNLYVVEQLPFIRTQVFEQALGGGTIGEFVCREVLHLSYTAYDLAPFARALGYDGAPFRWDEEDRRHRLARLDALFFRLYGLDRDDAAYVLDTFPIVKREDEARFVRYRTKELVLGYMNALAAGDIDSVLAL